MATLFLIFSVRLAPPSSVLLSAPWRRLRSRPWHSVPLFGVIFGHLFHAAFPRLGIQPGAFAIARHRALFAATVRAPSPASAGDRDDRQLSQLILPMMILPP